MIAPHTPALAAPTLARALEAAYRDSGLTPAVVTPAGTWTYRDLAARAHGVAEAVRTATPAAGRSPIVAVVLDRCPDFVATVMGVAAAGAVYLPLDPGAPDTYLGQIFDESRPSMVVTSGERAHRLRGLTRAPVVTPLDLTSSAPAVATGDAAGITGHPPEKQVSTAEVAPRDPAYVVYTSGSTGRPKGVVVSGEALLNATAARVDRYGPAGRVPLLHSPAFDLTTGVLFWTILSGGTLVIEPGGLADVAATVALIHRHDITHLIYPASLYGAFLDRAADRPPASLVAVGIGSERWSPVLIERHARVLPAVCLVNEYGPTEATVCSSYALLYDGPHARSAPMSIGRPVRNTGYLLLDSDRNLATGAGELAITGMNLALGYLNNPGLTAQRFVTLASGERAYLTGDLAERDPAGDFVFLGRADRQIQVGGHRVEPGHIETVLMGHPGVMQAHVAGLPGVGGTGSSTLVAYLVPHPDADSSAPTASSPVPARGGEGQMAGDCDQYLRNRVPAYLVPSAYVVLPELPRTPSGKIDEAKLPNPTVAAAAATADAPTDPLHQALVRAAAGVLGVATVPVDQPLTSLGASSLVLIRLAAVIAHDHGVDVPISALFGASAIHQIAELVRAGTPSGRPVLRPAAGEPETVYGSVWPLSGQQRQIWVLTQMAPDSLAYSTQFSLRMSGPVDLDALQAALSHVVARHEILRTTFHDGPDGPVQVVREPWAARVDLVDLSDLDADAQAAELDCRMRAAVAAGFDVAVLPLVRWHLFRLGPRSWRLLQVEHHFAHDGWSAQLFLAEMRDAYRAILDGEVPRLDALPVQYRDYATWYQQWRSTGDYADQVAYWRARLDGCPPEGVAFGPDRPRPAGRTYRGGRLVAHIPSETVRHLDELAVAQGVSRFAVFLAAFALQVWQHTHARDVVIGSALVNRRQAGTEALLGMFVNALPLRVDVDPDASTAALLQATMTTLLGAQDHQELPLLDLLAHLNVPRDPGNPLFNLMFAFHDTPRPDFQVGTLSGQLVIEHNGTSKADLNVVCVPDPPTPGEVEHRPGMSILWEFDSDLFDPDTARELLAGYERILHVLPQAPDRPVRDLDLLGTSETTRILAAGTGPHDAMPFGTLHAGFDSAAAAHPHAVALEHAGTRWTYRDLDLRAGALQHRLTALGVRPGHIVAVACPPGVELITTILATLRLGAAYVCLDPGQPPARTSLMLADADVRAIVTTHQTTNGHDTGWPPAGTALLYADDPAPGPEPAGPPPAAPGVRPDDRAYLVYTSGSTGTPKAVVTTHRNACAALHARTRHHAVTPAPARPARTLVTLPAIFDVAPHMMLWTLQTGGTIVLPDTAEQAQDPDQIRALVDRHQVTHVNFTASFYRALLGTMPTEWQPTLQVVAIGGEACAPDDVRDHARRLPHVALDNEYGPTEATVWCSVARLHPPEPDAESRVTVGLPLTNNSMFVLGPDGDLLPAGAAGELFIGGAGVAAGYHRQPDLTQQRFVTPRRGPLAGQRLYRTGDRARLRAGRYEILGRLDDQVKIRGYRIELGEITACLLQHPAVTDAAVTVQGRSDAGQLIAIVATAHPQACLPDLLRAWTAQRLPAYIAPAGYVVVDELPRTATGKLQPERLSTLSTPVAAAAPVAVPTTQRQQRLLRTWREQLQRPDLGIDDDFFACGGDSLQAIQAAARARDLEIDVTVAQLVAAPTIRALDRLLTTPDDNATVALAAPARRPGGTPLALTAIQAWFFAQNFADPDHFHQARLFTLADTCDLPSLRAAARWALHRHDAFRTRFTRHDHAWTAALDDATPGDPIREHTLPPAGNQPTSERLTPVLEGLHDDLSIASGRLASVTIVRDNDGRQRWLYIIAHHLIIDAVSWQILVDDVERAYRLLRAGQALPEGSTPGLPTAPTTPPKVGPEPDPYWQNLATAAKPVLTGTGSGGPPAPVGARIRVRRRLSTHAGMYLRHDAHRLRGVGAQAILLAALRRALQPFTDSPDLYVWLEGHGRSHHRSADHEGVVGWLTTLYPALLTATDAHPGRLIDVAADFQRQLAAIPDGGAGFGQSRYLHPDSPLGRQLEAIAAPQVTVNYLGHHQPTGRDRILRPVPGPTGASIAPSNVLPTPIDLTVTADPDGIMSCQFLIDTGLVTPQAAENMADRFTAEMEAAARLIALTPMPVQADARTLFLIHPVGGKIDWYTDLAAALGPGWDCYGLPHDGSTDADTLPAIAQTYLGRLRAAKPDGPYTLVGWCLGAVLAYEMTQQAQRDGDSHRIDDLFLLDPPHAEQPLDADDAIITHVQYALMQHGWPDQPRQAITAALGATSALPIPDQAHALAAVLAPESIVPPSWPSQHESLLHQMRIRLVCHAAMSAWHPAGQTPTLQLILPHTVTPGTENATRTWRTRSSDPHVTTVAGDHESMLTGPGLDQITTLLHERHSARPTHPGAAQRHHDRTGVFGYNALA